MYSNKKPLLAYPKKKCFLVILFFYFLGLLQLTAQERITTIYGTSGGFYSSSTSNVKTYNDSNNLLGFVSGGITFSTGVDDAALSANNVNFTSGKYLAFPMPGSIVTGNSSLIGIATNWGGVSQNNSANDFIYNFSPILPSFFVRDGLRGLELGSNYFNIPRQTIIYDAIIINENTSINDTKPDILVTQTGQPGKTDKFKFIDANGNTVGQELDVVFSSTPRVGITQWTIYRVNPNTGKVTGVFSGGINSPRDLRLISFKLSDFGITTANFDDISNFVHTTSGNTDIAFTAYNSEAIKIQLQDGELAVSNSAVNFDDLCSPSSVSFTTKITNNSATRVKDFEVDFNLPQGVTPTTSTSNFNGSSDVLTFDSGNKKWSISGLNPGGSVTLTVNATTSGVSFPASFTATTSLLFQNDSNAGNNSETIIIADNCDADLSLTKTVNKSVLKVGENAEFKLELKNSGELTATGVKVKDLLPQGLAYDAAKSQIPNGTTYNANTGIWDLSNISINKGQTVTLILSVKVNTSGLKMNKTEVFTSNQSDKDSSPNNDN